MIQYKVPARKLIEIEFNDGSKAILRNPSGADIDALMDKIASESSEEGKQKNYKLFYEYVIKLGEGTEKPVTMEQLTSMDNGAFSDVLGFLNGSKKN